MEDLYCDRTSCSGDVEYDFGSGTVRNVSCPTESCAALKPVNGERDGWSYASQNVQMTRNELGNCVTNHGQLSDYDTAMICDNSPTPTCGYTDNYTTCDDVEYIKRFNQMGSCV